MHFKHVTVLLPLAFLPLVVASSAPTPVNRSFIAFTIAEKDLLPENVAYDPEDGAFYVGSTRKGKIVRVDREGQISDFVTSRRDGLFMVIGMKVDARRRVLWVASSAGDNLVGPKPASGNPAGVFKFDLRTGALIKKYVLDGPGETHFLNDLVVTESGDVYVTHMFRESLLYRITVARDALEVFARPDGVTEPNGIALSDDGRLLFVAHNEGVSAFDVSTGARRPIAVPADVSLKGIDGLYFRQRSLIAVHPDRRMVRRYALDRSLTTVVGAETLEADHPLFNNPTTGVLVDDTLYYVANAQFGSFDKDGVLFPMERLFEVVVLKVSLRRAPGPELVAAHLDVPWWIAFAPDGRIFVTERPGRIRVIEKGTLRPEPWARLEVVQEGDGGLRGLALSPDFERTKHVFVTGTFRALSGRNVTRVYRFTEKDGRGTEPAVILDDIPSPGVHGGGALAFGPDGMLYLSVGDGRTLASVQDPKSALGKILRFRADGSVPDDNPEPGSRVYARGVRNPQGLAWHPDGRALFATEHGPTDFPDEGGRSDQDELNVISSGGNYGWPVVSGLTKDARFLPPLVEWTPAIAPAGLAICDARDSPWFGDLFVGGMRGQQLRRIHLEKSGTSWRLSSEEPLFSKELGRIRAVAMGPEGFLYFGTSNKDSEGRDSKLAGAEDDRLFRLQVGGGR